jgi:TRAP-type C4-dicarboxylate transport system substrate-binding protein
MEKLWKELGFRVFPLSLADLPTSLQTDLINAFNLPPEYALMVNAYRQAPNMIDIKWVPLVAGMVIDLEVWNKLPDEYRSQMLTAAREAGDRYRDDIRKLGDDSIREMKSRGLNIVELDAETLAIWQREAEKAYPKLRGRYTPAPLFDEALHLRDELRNSKGQEIAE